jgi:predicted Zn-dependent peptidase
VGREVLGDEETIGAMSRADIADFHALHYRPGNVIFAAAGQLEHAAVVDGIERRCTAPGGGGAPVRSVPTAPPRALAVDPRPTEQVHLVLGMRSLDRHDDDRYALAVVNHVLGGGLSSRLFQKVREERGLAYSVYSYRSAFADAGALAVYAGTMPARADEVLGLVRTELEAMASSGMTRRELEVAQGHLVGELALSLEDSAARMSRIGRNQLVHGKVLTVDEVVERIAAVTLDDANEVAARILGNDQVLAVVGPVEESAFDTPRVA